MLLKKNKEKNIFLHPYSSCKKFQNRDRIGFKQRVLTIQIRNGENCEKGTAILKNLLINAVAENEKKKMMTSSDFRLEVAVFIFDSEKLLLKVKRFN